MEGNAISQVQRSINAGNECCAYCGVTNELSIDHIIPQTIIRNVFDGGAYYVNNWKDNLQVLCLYCNRHKGSRIDTRNKKTFQLLDELIDMAKKRVGYIEVMKDLPKLNARTKRRLYVQSDYTITYFSIHELIHA